MHFRMLDIGLHYYDPENEDFLLASTVACNKESYRKQQINAAEHTRELYAYIGYPSIKDYKWVIQSNQIKDCPVMVQDIDVDHNIWVKGVTYLKGKTTRKKPIDVAGDLVQEPKQLVKLH